MTGEYSSKPEPRRPTWQPEFIDALTERVLEKWPERIKLAENAIFDRIDALEESSARIEDLNERWAMSCSLAILRSFQLERSEACKPAMQNYRKAA